MKITTPKLHASQLTNEAALQKCQSALEKRDKGDYEGAREVMRPLWKRIGQRPEVKDLHASVSAEVLICVGILTSWIGSKEELEDAQEVAKDLITEGMTFYETIGDVRKVTAASAEIAYCYFREGALNEARTMLTEALERLTTEENTKARALLRLAIVECSASRYEDASKILSDNAPLFSKINNHAIIGAYHNQIAMVLRKLVRTENRNDYLQRALRAYQEADAHFKLAHNTVFRANVKNNVGNVLRQLSQFQEAHRYLEGARRLAVSIRNRVQTAEIDDTRAQVFIAEGRLKEAEAVAGHAVKVLGKSGQHCLLADALITHGIALARLGKSEQAQFTLQRAVNTAHQVGALNKAGMASLTLIEEIEGLSPEVREQAYDHASEWLATSQSQEVLQRVIAVSKKIRVNPSAEMQSEDATEPLPNIKRDLNQEKLKTERELIRQALAKVGGRLTQAASLLGTSYQGLAYIIERRHRDLLKDRTPIRRRSPKK
ncbi:MAG: helix-turn-helix domain-containing protein [Acidobacteriota bacterium]